MTDKYKYVFDFDLMKELINDGHLKRIGTSTYIVFQALFLFANFSTGHCFPSQKTISERTGLSERTVSRGINTLQRYGYIEVIRGKPKRNRKGKIYKNENNNYQIVLPLPKIEDEYTNTKDVDEQPELNQPNQHPVEPKVENSQLQGRISVGNSGGTVNATENLMEPGKYYYHPNLKLPIQFPFYTQLDDGSFKELWRNEKGDLVEEAPELIIDFISSFTIEDALNFYYEKFPNVTKQLRRDLAGMRQLYETCSYDLDLLLFTISGAAALIYDEDKRPPKGPIYITDYIDEGNYLMEEAINTQFEQRRDWQKGKYRARPKL